MSNRENQQPSTRPAVYLSQENGNVFTLLAVCTRALKRAGQREQADRLVNEGTMAHSYDEALRAMMRYCEVS